MSQSLLTGVDNEGVFVTVDLVTGVSMDTGVGNCRLLQTICLFTMSVGVDEAPLLPVGPWLDEETVGLSAGPGREMLLLASIVGVLVTCHELEPSGMRA